MGTEAAWVPWVVGALSAAGSVYNGERVAHNQDQALAQSLRTQGRHQREADAKVNDQVAALEASRSEDERAKRQMQYLDALARGRATKNAGLVPTVGSAAFAADTDAARAASDALATRAAGLEARIDAPGLQRQDEGFGFGRLATDLGLVKRQSAGDAYLDQLRLRAIRRNPYIDAAASFGQGYAASSLGGAGGAGGASGSGTPFTELGAANDAGYGAFTGAGMTTPGYWQRNYPWLQRAGG